MRLDVKPGKGIGPIHFGMYPADVLVILGEPMTYEDWMGGNLNDALFFQGLCLHFNQCDSRAPLAWSRLAYIRIHGRHDAYLFERPFRHWTRDDLLKELSSRSYASEVRTCGDVLVRNHAEFDFDDDGLLIGAEVMPAE